MKLSECKTYQEAFDMLKNNKELFTVEYLGDGLYQIQCLITEDKLLDIEPSGDSDRYWLVHTTSHIQEAYTTIEEAEECLEKMGVKNTPTYDGSIPVYCGQVDYPPAKLKYNPSNQTRKWNVVYLIRKTIDVIVEARSAEEAMEKVNKQWETGKLEEAGFELVDQRAIDAWELRDDKDD